MKEVVEKPKKDASGFFAENSVKETHVEHSVFSNAFKDSLRQEVFQQYNNSYSSKMENRPIWRRWQILSAGALALVVGATGLFIFSSTNDNESNTDLGAQIAYIDGDLEYLMDGEIWADATLDTNLAEGDSVRITGVGRAIINLDDGSSVRLGSDTTISLSSMNPNDIVISNEEGEVYTRVVKADRSFTVDTGDVSFKSLGTAYKTVNTNDQKGVYVYHSDVAVKEGEEDIIVKEGSKYYIKDQINEKEDEILELTEEDLKDEFIQWNKEQDEKEFQEELGVLGDAKGEVEGVKTEVEEVIVEETKEEVVATEPKTQTKTTTKTTTTTSISAVTPFDYGKFKVQWAASGDTSKGFKIIYNQAGNPSYPNDNPTYISDGSKRSAVVSGVPAGTYYVRVCRYTGTGCDSYSNQVSVTVQAQQPVSSISLSYGSGQLSWTTDTGTTGQGFKIVKNDAGAPTYPDNSISYVNGFAFTPSANGYYRICAWDGNSGCTAYSNEIQVSDK